VAWVVVLEAAASPFADHEGSVGDWGEVLEGGAEGGFGDCAGLLCESCEGFCGAVGEECISLGTFGDGCGNAVYLDIVSAI